MFPRPVTAAPQRGSQRTVRPALVCDTLPHCISISAHLPAPSRRLVSSRGSVNGVLIERRHSGQRPLSPVPHAAGGDRPTRGRPPGPPPRSYGTPLSHAALLVANRNDLRGTSRHAIRIQVRGGSGRRARLSQSANGRGLRSPLREAGAGAWGRGPGATRCWVLIPTSTVSASETWAPTRAS